MARKRNPECLSSIEGPVESKTAARPVAPKRRPEKEPRKEPEKVPEDAPENVPKDMSANEPKTTARMRSRKSGNVPNVEPTERPERTPREGPAEGSDSVLKNVSVLVPVQENTSDNVSVSTPGGPACAAAQAMDCTVSSSTDHTINRSIDHTINSTTDHTANSTTINRSAANSSTKQSGCLESIELTDFMCHRRFRMEFSPLINFIYGNNGSGKSAILTAITVALGGRANVTQRGNNFDALIREGSTSAKIRIKLGNRGDNAFQPGIYGEHIIVERVLKREGASSYSIYNSNKQVVATRKEELSAICDHFAIQVDNPLVVLTQETAKKFLASSNPESFYKFFMQATQLDQMCVDYKYACDQLEKCQSAIKHIIGGLEPIRDSIRKYEKQLVDLEKYAAAEKTKQSLIRELTWAMVEQNEAELRKLQGRLAEKRREMQRLQQTLEDFQAGYQKLEERICKLEATVAEAGVKTSTLSESRRQFKEEVKDIEREVKTLQEDAKAINRDFQRLQADLGELNERIAQEESRQGDDRQERLRARVAEIDTEIQTLNQRVHDEQKSEDDANARLGELESCLANISRKREELERERAKGRTLLENAERTKGSRIAAFGAQMPALLAEIEGCRSKFSELPILAGQHVRLKEANWAIALEAAIAGNLETLIVNNHKDKALLASLIRKHNLRNPIIILRFRGDIDITSGLPDRRFRTALDVLEIDHPVVRKMLILFCALERGILVEDERKAKEIALSRPRNVTTVYTPTLKMTSGRHSLSVMHLYVDHNRPRLIEDSQNRITYLERKLHDVTRQLEVVQADFSKAHADTGAAHAGAERARNERSRVEHKLRSIKDEQRNIQTELRGRDTMEQSYYVTEKERLEAQSQALAAQFQASKDQIKDLQQRKQRVHDQMKTFDAEFDAVRAEWEAATEELTKDVRVRKKLDGDVIRHTRDLEAMKKDEDDQGSAIDAMSRKVDAMALDATRLCHRVHVTRPREDLEIELNALNECLESQATGRLDPIAVKTMLDEKRVQLRESEKSIVYHDTLIKSFDSSMEQRWRDWEDFRRCVAKQCTSSFIFFLQARGFQGSLEFRHSEAQLNINVVPRVQQENARPSRENEGPRDRKRRRTEAPNQPPVARDIRQLSGGEKSYSTACFLFSLWQCMGCPIRCLDEFDVYMDSVNRDFILELLVSSARSSKTQFILITPNRIPYSGGARCLPCREQYKAAHDVHVCRLQDPDRNQSTLM